MAPVDDEDPWFSHFLRSGVADGVLLLSTHDGDPLPDELVRAGIPLAIDGLFVANDIMAIGAIRALRNAGRRVPEDVAVIGFDDIDIAADTDPPLTTIRQPAAEMTRTMVDLLLRRVRGEAVPDAVLLPTQLVVRASG